MNYRAEKRVPSSGQMASRTAYDEVRYSNHPYAQTHPDRLATVAALHGLPAPDPRECRVLELGCGAGGNLLAMAAATPGLHALGVDLAAGPIADAARAAAEIGVGTIEFRQGDITEIQNGELGEFDYVIAHGVYAWVPPRSATRCWPRSTRTWRRTGSRSSPTTPTRAGICARRCARPGCGSRRASLARRRSPPRAQELYRYLMEQRAGEGDPWGSVLAKTLPPLIEGPVYRLVHDDLGEYWGPAWFSEFVGSVGAVPARLRRRRETSATCFLRSLPDEIEPSLRELAAGDRIVRRAGHRHAALQLLPPVGAVPGQPPDGGRPDAHPGRDVQHVRSRRRRAGARRGDRAARLGAEPLRARGCRRRSPSGSCAALGAEAAPLAEALLEGFRTELVMPHIAPLRVAPVADQDRPMASRLARWQAPQGPRSRVSPIPTCIWRSRPRGC